MLSPLHRKLLRDLRHARAQALAIALVIAVGVMLLVMMSGLVTSLSQTKAAYYARYRMADVFAPVERAPDRVLGALSSIQGVSRAAGRISGPALIHVAGEPGPLRARLLSLPDDGAPTLNAIRLVRGHTVDAAHPDDVVVLRGFADARGIAPGDTLDVTLHGIRRGLPVVGVAESPELIYATPPGEIAADPARYAVIWMGRRGAAAAYGLRDSFNEALLALTPDAREAAVLAATDRVLARYGSTGAFALRDQRSNQFVSDEIAGLRAVSAGVPPIFLGVAAFLLYIVISRMVQAEREQIGLLEAFGYTAYEVGAHYLQFVLVIALGGALAGSALGVAAGHAMAGFYLHFFRFPSLPFHAEPWSVVTGFVASAGAASVAGLGVLRRLSALAPAEAMQPPTPPVYGRSPARHLAVLFRNARPVARMVARRLLRHPARSGGAIAGIALSMALTVAMLAILASYDTLVSRSFDVVDRSDVAVIFTQPQARAAALELAHTHGVLDVQPVRDVPVELRHGLHTHRGAITGLPPDARLYRAVDPAGRALSLPERGLVLSTTLARLLDARPGSHIEAAVREGRRPVLELPVTAVADVALGAPAFMRLDALDRALREPGRLSGAFVRVDRAQERPVLRELAGMPAVAGVSVKREVRRALVKLLDTGAGAMRFILTAMAAVITFGIVFNTARIAFAERASELATLRVLGFSRAEVAFVLLGELGVITLLALPCGAWLGHHLSFVVAAAFSTEQYQIPVVSSPAAYGEAALGVLTAAVGSSALVVREIARMDVVSTLKTRE